MKENNNFSEISPKRKADKTLFICVIPLSFSTTVIFSCRYLMLRLSLHTPYISPRALFMLHRNQVFHSSEHPHKKWKQIVTFLDLIGFFSYFVVHV